MDNKIKFGLCNVHYANYKGIVANKHTYDTPVPMPGGINISLAPSGSTDPFYADNIVYYSTTTNSGYAGDLETAAIPDLFRTDILGELTDKNGVQIENSDAVGSEFALLFQFEGDVTNKRHVLFRCKAERPNVDGATKEEKTTPQTDKLSITVMAREGDHQVKANVSNSTETKTAYDAWFTSVYEPDFTVGE